MTPVLAGNANIRTVGGQQDLRKLLQRQLDKGKIPDIVECVKQACRCIASVERLSSVCVFPWQASCLSQGMKYQFATGNWGQDFVPAASETPQ